MSDNNMTWRKFYGVEWGDLTEDLTTEEKAMLWDAVCAYMGQKEPTLTTPATKLVFKAISRSFARDEESYLRRCNANRENISKRWGDANTNGYDSIPMVSNGNDSIPNDTKRREEKRKEKREKKEQEQGSGGSGRPGEEAKETTTTASPVFENTLSGYATRHGINGINEQELAEFQATISDDAIKFAIEDAADRAVPSWALLRSILGDYVRDGVHNLKQAQQRKWSHLQARKQTEAAKGNPALNYPQRDYKETDDFRENAILDKYLKDDEGEKPPLPF